MRVRARVGCWVGTAVLVASALSGCGGADGEHAGSGGTPVPGASSSSVPVATSSAEPSAAAEPAPGDPCEEGSHPDCTDATGTDGEPFRIVAGYADCVASFGQDEADGLCVDLDGDDHAGYADAG